MFGLPNAYSDEDGQPFRRKAATHSDRERPLWPGLDMGGVIVAAG
jgi:hypothetical protein